MSNSENTQGKWSRVGSGLKAIGNVIRTIFEWIFKLRKLILAIPVVAAAAMLAIRNSQQLPEEVGLILMSDGSFGQMVPRNIAVLGPVAVTSLCLLLMMCSRKTLYPWLISIFSLVLPVMLMLIGMLSA